MPRYPRALTCITDADPAAPAADDALHTPRGRGWDCYWAD